MSHRIFGRCFKLWKISARLCFWLPDPFCPGIPTFVSIRTHRTPAIGRHAPTDTSHAVWAAKASRDVGLVRQDPCTKRVPKRMAMVWFTAPKHGQTMPELSCLQKDVVGFFHFYPFLSISPFMGGKKDAKRPPFEQKTVQKTRGVAIVAVVPSESWNPSSTSSDRYQSLLCPWEPANLEKRQTQKGIWSTATGTHRKDWTYCGSIKWSTPKFCAFHVYDLHIILYILFVPIPLFLSFKASSGNPPSASSKPLPPAKSPDKVNSPCSIDLFHPLKLGQGSLVS